MERGLMENKRKLSKQHTLNVTRIIKMYDNCKWCLNIAFQRQLGQWDREHQSSLIDSILQGYKIPDLWICVTPTESYPANSIIDGVQRMTTVIQFVKDEFALSKKLPPLIMKAEDYDNLDEDVTYEIAGKKFSKLPKELQETIMYYDFSMQELYNYTDDEIEEQFYRLNNGVAMTPSQKLKVILGTTVAEKIKPLTELPFWSRTKFTKAQIKHDETYATVLQCLMLTTGYEFTDFSKTEIMKFAAYYSENCNDKELEYLKELITTLDDNMATSDENNKFLTKINIPPLVANADKFLSLKYDGEFTEDDYTKFLNDWVDHNAEYSGYLEQKTNHTTNGSKVKNRIKLLDEWLDTYAAYKRNGELPLTKKINNNKLEENSDKFETTNSDFNNLLDENDTDSTGELFNDSESDSDIGAVGTNDERITA